MTPLADKVAGLLLCPECGHSEPRTFPPLCIVTGPSGAGKTAIVPCIQALLPHWEVFETDILWDSGGDWSMVKANWVRIADSLAQRPHSRLTILCGTIQPEDVMAAGAGWMFGEVHFLALTCEESVLAERLRSRPAWRGCNEELIQQQLEYQRWLYTHAEEAFDPPLVLIDTADTPIQATAETIRAWAQEREHISTP